ncbi:MAG: GntR family transcriptional regulator [Alphaproteobacteria bacterium]
MNAAQRPCRVSKRTPGYAGEHIDARQPTPLYHQIYTILRDEIVNGGYANGDILPSEFELTQAYGVSRVTAKRALNELAADGLVSRERGRGTVVRFEAASAPVQASVEGLIENLLQMGLKTSVRLISFDYIPASNRIARALGCDAGEEVQRAIRVRSLEGEPFSHLTTHVPADIGRSYSRGDLASLPLLGLLERCGVVVSSARQTLTASLADARIAPLLDVQAGAPLLRITRTVYDQDASAVEHITGLYRPDRYQYQMKLNRIEGGDRKIWSPAV